MEIPVKSTFFPPLRLSPRETSAYFVKAQKALDQVRDAATSFSWKRIESKDGLVVGKVHCIEQHPKEVRVGRSTACLVVRATTSVRATVPEIVQILSAQETEAYRKDMRRLHGKNFIDAVALTSLESGSTTSTCQVKWAAFKEAETSMDYCFLEYAGVLEGRSPIGFCVYQSIEREREVPELSALGFRREELKRTGYLVQKAPESDDMVVVTAIAQGAPSASDKSPEKLETLLHHRVARVLLQLSDFVSMRRLGLLPAVDRTQWIHDTCRKFCAVCLKSFKFTRKHHCRMCGEVVCGPCAIAREVDIPSLGTSAFVRVCNVCVGRAHSLAASKRVSNQTQLLANDSFDVVDPRALMQFSDDDDDIGSNHTSLSSSSISRVPSQPSRGASSLGSCLFDDIDTQEEIESLREQGLKLRTVSHDSVSSASSSVDFEYPAHSFQTPAQGTRNVRQTTPHDNASGKDSTMKSVHELFARLSQIRETLNQNMPKQKTPTVNPKSPHLLLENPRVVLIEDDDIPIDFVQEPLQLEVPPTRQEDSKSKDSTPERVSEVREPETPFEDVTESQGVKETVDSTPKSNNDDVSELRSQISELHRLLATANERLQAVEAAAANSVPSSSASSTTRLDRAMRYVEVQSGNLAGDPIVAARRRAHQAVVSELHEIMGL